MFRDMRRKNQLLPQEEAEAILRQGTSGVLSLLGDGGYPYGVPLSYVYHNGKLYFHCAKAGHKLDAIRREGKCSFCVIDQDQVVAEKYTTLFRSVIAFGQVRVLEDDGEKRAALEALDALMERDVIFEINTGAISRGYRDTPYPAMFLLREWRGMGGQIILTADAHSPETVVYGYRQAAELARMEAEKRGRMYRVLGLAVGGLLVILLL